MWKHAALVEVLQAMDARPLHYFETHAGPGPVTLEPGGEWERGLARLRADPLDSRYERLLDEGPYPGSWGLAARAAAGRPFRMTLCETSAEVRALAAPSLPPEAVLLATDGFATLRATTGVDLVLVDPPFGRGSGDWQALSDEALTAGCRAALLWYPVFSPMKPAALVEALGATAWELLWSDLSGEVGFASKGAGLAALGEAADVLRAREPFLDALASRLGGRLNVRRRT